MRTLLRHHGVECTSAHCNCGGQLPKLFPRPFLGALPHLACMFLVPPASRAAPLSLTILNPSLLSPPGGVVVFQGTITNNTGASLNTTDLFVNSFGFDPGVVSITQLLGNSDFMIQTGATSPTVDIFSFGLGLGATVNKTYSSSVFLQDVNNNLTASVDVTVKASLVPEPGTLMLIGCGVVAMWVFRLRRSFG